MSCLQGAVTQGKHVLVAYLRVSRPRHQSPLTALSGHEARETVQGGERRVRQSRRPSDQERGVAAAAVLSAELSPFDASALLPVLMLLVVRDGVAAAATAAAVAAPCAGGRRVFLLSISYEYSSGFLGSHLHGDALS